MKLKVLPRTLSQHKIAKLISVSSFVDNEFFGSRNYVTDESFFTCFGFLEAWFSSVYKNKCFLVNICKQC